MKYKIKIKDGIPYSIFAGQEINLKTVKSVSFVGKKDCHVRITYMDDTEKCLLEDEVEMKYT
jgi:hypothetical protein